MREKREGNNYDLYETLGVSRGATTQEIRRAYRRLAREHHPDLHPDDSGAEEKFKRISVAYQVLSDPARRALYDEFGLEGLAAGFDPNRARAARRAAQRAGPSSLHSSAARAQPRPSSFDDVINDLFAGFGRKQALRRGRDAEFALEVDLLEALRGVRKTIRVRRLIACDACAGSGVQVGDGRLCPSCGGQGRTRLGPAALGLERSCQRCRGLGVVDVPPCKRCEGCGRVRRLEKLVVKIPAGVSEGSRVRVAGKGEEGPKGSQPGDLLLLIKVKPHPYLERRGLDLLLDLPVTVGEAMLGAVISVPTLEGRVRLKVPKGSQSGQKLRLKGRGISDSRTGQRGDMYVRLMVRLPPNGGEKVREAVSILENCYPENPRKDLCM